MKQLPKFESVWGKITTRNGKLFIITFNIKDKLYRLYCIHYGSYQLIDKSKDAIRLLQKQQKI